MALTGITSIDDLAGGLPRGALSEIFGPPTSGRTSLIFSALAEATAARQEVCALVDATDSFDPVSAAAAGINLQRLLWVRCGEALSHCPPTVSRSSGQKFRALDCVLKTTDLLLQSGGFGMVIVDMGDVPGAMARRIPLTSWFRFRRAVENTPTVLIAIEQEPYARTCASLVLRLDARAPEPVTNAADAQSAAIPGFTPASPFSQARVGNGAVRRRWEPGYPNPQCYPDFERVPRFEKAAAGACAALEFRGKADEPSQPAGRSNCCAPRPLPNNLSLPAHARNLLVMPIGAELVHARGQKKPARRVTAFETRTAWAR
jgi:hypothetical protein